jgi:hypothetical protein
MRICFSNSKRPDVSFDEIPKLLPGVPARVRHISMFRLTDDDILSTNTVNSPPTPSTANRD